eukprot:CAMPEP_0184340024 /NCGR_PEP_ID=MMETSP1089-20130417/8687_1 /TAXON_ID=38269 ORGANISM="Gloeochaete wittrockiana, Strain SAG46.84" /NCGR_SAMPLE_ID=MMETSP1089 /ASSEMBLY_ACC=CAM_ASM_000445 /LENGTH=144 /DNA_ID=CAMNT_0026667601 /DNA_START=10 /DNA_END=444 /DNA_ORIENTATION=+
MTKVTEKIKMFRPRIVLQFNHWARTLAMAGSELLMLGGFISIWYAFAYFWLYFFLGIYSFLVGLAIFPFVFPLEIMRKKGFLVYFQQFRIVGPALILLSIPTVFAMPCIIGGTTLFASGVLYLAAAFRKEKQLTKDQIIKGSLI